jgi:hypothetical protein
LDMLDQASLHIISLAYIDRPVPSVGIRADKEIDPCC